MKNKLESFLIENKLFAQTHSGVFHCDDVFATALLEMYCDYFDVEFILERNDQINYRNRLFFDVGFKHDPENGYFDHHQDDDTILHTVKRPDGEIVYEKRSSFGLLWQYLGDLFLEGRSNWVFDTQFVSRIDHFDNYGGNDSLLLAIKDMNHIDIYARNAITAEDQFKKAVDLARTVLKAKIDSLRDSQIFMEELFRYAEREEVKQSGILVVDMYISGMNSALGTKTPWVNFFIAPSERNDGYNLFPIYKDKIGTPKVPITLTDNCVFTNNRFAQFNSIDDAVECAKKSITENLFKEGE